MKIAVIFLCLSIASFIDTIKGNDIKLKPLDKNKADYHVRCVQGIAQKVEILKTCPESEKKTRQLCLVEDLIYALKMISLDVGCTVNELLKILNLPLNVVQMILNNNLEGVLKEIELEALLNPFIVLLEGVLAQINIVLKTQLVILNKLLGSAVGLLSIFSGLHNTVTEIVAALTGTLLGTVLGLLGNTFQIVGGLTGNLLGNGLLG